MLWPFSSISPSIPPHMCPSQGDCWVFPLNPTWSFLFIYLFILAFPSLPPLLSACSLTALIPPSLCVKRKLQAFNIWCVWIAHKQVSVKRDQVILWVVESALPQHHHHVVMTLFPTSKQYKICLFSNLRSLSMNKLAAIWSLSICMISALINY